MKFKFATSMTISADTVKEIICKAVEDETGMKVKSVELNLVTQSVGYGYSERDEKAFAGATVHFKETVSTGTGHSERDYPGSGDR